jgi:cobalt-zinc-cadmium efflux system membrane fusion protein
MPAFRPGQESQARKGGPLHSRVQQIGNLLVLALLIGLGIWGHRNHWQIRRHGEVTKPAAGDAGRRSQAFDQSAETAEREQSSSDRFAAGQAADLQIVRFQSAAAVKQAGIRVDPAHVQQLDEYVEANGVVGYDETRVAQLSSRVPGIAWRVEKHVGDQAHKGEILAILDSIEVGNAKAKFLEAAVDYDVKTQNLKHLEQISSAVPARTLRDARGDVRESRIRRFNARQTLINLGLPLPHDFAIDLPDEQLMQRIQFLGLPPHIVAELEPAVATANLLPIVAPFDGVLINSEIVTGEVVQTANQQFVIADVSHMWLKLDVKKAEAVRLELGQRVRFLPDGAAGELESTVSWIGTEVDEKTRTVQVRAIAGNPIVPSPTGTGDGQRLLRANTFGTARIRVRENRSTVVVPHSAIQWDGERHMVFVPLPDGCSFALRTVIPGATHDKYTEIVSGIAADEFVVSLGSYVLKSELGRGQTAAAKQ